MGSNVSSTINHALRAEVERRRQQEGLKDLVEWLKSVHGPFDTAEDVAEIERLKGLLDGAPQEGGREDAAA